MLSNQAGISLKPDPKTIKSDQKRLADFKAKLSAVFTQLELPISIYAATSHDRYRKPRVGMWEELREDYDLENAEAVDVDNSFFVGDAAGREASGSRTKDFSCGDRLALRSDSIPAREGADNYVETLPPTWESISTRLKNTSWGRTLAHSLENSTRPFFSKRQPWTLQMRVSQGFQATWTLVNRS